MKIKPFEASPTSHYCKVQNVLWDVIMPTCTPAEFMILNLIFRKTVGFNKAEDRLSYGQIRAGTGIKGKATISKALDGLERKTFIIRRGVERGSIWYGVNPTLEIEVETGSEIEPNDAQTGSENRPDQREVRNHLVQKLNQSGSEIEPDDNQLVQKLNTPKDKLLKDKRQTTSSTDFDLDFSDCLNLYKNNIDSTVSPIILYDVQDIFDDLSPPSTETKFKWFQYAIFEALASKAPNWKYVKAIIDNIRRAGSLAQHKENRNGQTRTDPGKQQTKCPPQTRGDWQKSADTPGDTPRDAETNARLRSAFGR